MASTKVEVRDNRELRRVEALDEDGEVAGWAEYQIGLDGSTFDFTHTEVDERFEGQGIGTQLAAGVVEFVRAEGARIIPSCSFIRHYMDKHEDTQDLRAEPSTDEDEESEEEPSESRTDTADQADSDEDGDEDGSPEDESPEDESPEAGPADAKAAGSGGAAAESQQESRQESEDEQP